MKLEVNDDQFRNENSKIIYLISRLEGRALDQLVPLISVCLSYTPWSILWGLRFSRYFASWTCHAKQGSEDFATYYSKFLCIIAYLNYNEAAKIDTLLGGLSDNIKDAMIYCLQKSTSLEGYAIMQMTMDNRIRSRKAEQKVARNSIGRYTNPNTTHPSHIAGGLALMDFSVS